MNYGGAKSGANQGSYGRVLAFAGDTTHRWVRNPETQEMHRRFWKHMVLWLAKQEDPEGSVWIRPDARRLPVGGSMGFATGLSKAGLDLPGGTFTAKLYVPGEKDAIDIDVGAARDGMRGLIDGKKKHTTKPGTYRLTVSGSGKDTEGQDVKGETTVRFIVFDDDVESAQQAADHAYLRKLAAAGGGEFHEGAELADFLRDLRKQLKDTAKGQEEHIPNWDTRDRSPFLALFFVLFVAVIGSEWFLRRRWGLV
jgi:hypothetical protein